MKHTKNSTPTRDLPSVDDYVIRRKSWNYLDAKGDRVVSTLINLASSGIHRLN